MRKDIENELFKYGVNCQAYIKKTYDKKYLCFFISYLKFVYITILLKIYTK